MLICKSITQKAYFRLLIMFLLFILFQGCKIYQEPISLNQALNSKEDGILKITMLNGDKFIYEDIEVIEDDYYAINFNNGEKVKTLINKDEIKDVQFRNNKSAKSSNFLGISIGVLTIMLGVFMF